MVLSDHGFAPLKKEVYINPFLAKQGFLTLKSEGGLITKGSIPKREHSTWILVVFISIIKILYPRGKVGREEKAGLLKEVRQSLEDLKGEDGQKIIDRIFPKEEIYHGPYAGSCSGPSLPAKEWI